MNMAEVLVLLRRQLGGKKIMLFDKSLFKQISVDTALARVKTTMDFDKAKPSQKLSALVEDWDLARIRSEIY